MSHASKISTAAALLRHSTSLALSHSYPVWIDAAEGGLVAPPTAMPRVRDALVLRLVAGRRATRGLSFSHGPATP